MKVIMISIQPQWVEKILNGEKTIEIRKTKPNCELPCKVYIYCTKRQELWGDSTGNTWYGIAEDEDMEIVFELTPTLARLNGKVIAEFTLNKIDKFDSAYSEWAYSVAPEYSEMPISETRFIQMAEQKGKLDCNDLLKYFGDEDYIAYMWHIDNLKIYDKPKELSEFRKRNKCHYADYDEGCCFECCTFYDLGDCDGRCSKLERPPQSWCYVEELENE